MFPTTAGLQTCLTTLIAPNEIRDFDRFHTEFGPVLKFIQASGDRKRMEELLDTDTVYQSLDHESAVLLKAVANLKAAIPKGGSVDMCKAWEEYGNSQKKEGLAEGHAEGLAEGHAEGLAEGHREGRIETFISSIRSLAEKYNMSIEQAMDAISVPDADRSTCLRILQQR